MINLNQSLETKEPTNPNLETIIIPTKSGVAAVEIGNNAAQLQAHERLLADAGRGITFFGGSVFAFNLIIALAGSYPLLLAFLAIAFPLSAHALSKRLSKPLKLALAGILLASLGTSSYSMVSELYPQIQVKPLQETHKNIEVQADVR